MRLENEVIFMKSLGTGSEDGSQRAPYLVIEARLRKRSDYL